MDWMILITAGLTEVIGVMGIDRLNRHRNLASFSIMAGGFIISFILLSIAMQSIPMSTAYAVWTGMGTVGSALVGMIFLGESKDWKRLLFISFILSAAVGLRLVS
ncbi:multidrug efflux SMR transporter [Virgibacillus sp. YIM 98842]|jgi:paired small multidrug resistance pump|uniref:DMT family transporter n=1 Tax=Virgibacillus sp. YIM 98842 TaxID=2663533 RepID=UPI0013DC6673|nr:multidrug efflux SMR transporter [Virgibacillus sp. YIM 98842]